MTNKPLVSVLMPVYNTERFLRQAIDSILTQTYTNFELIAINDGSTDSSKKILEEYAKRDSRIKVTHQKNKGLVATLNLGITLANGEYIARMDADDISFPRRFEQQVEVLQKQKKTVLVCGGFEVIDEESEFLYREVLPHDSEDIKRSMLLRNPMAHGSVMFRKNAAEKVGGYSDSFGPTEDFELWSRLSILGDFVALETTIFRWRVNSAGITSNNNKLQFEIMKRHTNALWASNFPRVLSAQELRAKSRVYFLNYKKRGVDMKRIMLTDNASIAIKMIVRGHLVMGLHQLLAVATANRTGIRAVIHRLQLTIDGKTNSLRRYAKFGRQET